MYALDPIGPSGLQDDKRQLVAFYERSNLRLGHENKQACFATLALRLLFATMAVLDPFGLVDFRDVVEQAERVRFGRVVEHFSRSTLIHDLTVVHNEDTVRNVVCKTDIVGYEHHGHLQFVFQLAEVIEDVCTNASVHHGGSFVSDQHLRTECEDTGEKHTLHLTTGKFERILAFDICRSHVHSHE